MPKSKKRNKPVRKAKSAFLNPDLDAINQTLSTGKGKKKKWLWVECDDWQCTGSGLAGTYCPECHFMLPEKGSNVLNLPGSIKSGTPTGATSHYSGSGTTGWQGTTGSGYVSHYHVGDKIIFEHDGKKLYAASGSGLDEFSGKWDLIIDLAHNVRFGDKHGFVKERSEKKFDALRKYTYEAKKVKSEVLQLDWNDGGVPPAGLDFWIKLWSMLPEKTVMACVGGHGRTGTCLASLMIASGQHDYYAAVDLVRNEHCKKAIETISQEKYLHTLYMDMLKRNIEHETDEKRKEDLVEDLKYAEAYVPNNYSSHGEKEPEKAKPVGFQPTHQHSHQGKLVPAGQSTVVDSAASLKIVGDQFYAQICVEPTCKKQDCKDAAHVGWVEYEPEEDAALWAH